MPVDVTLLAEAVRTDLANYAFPAGTAVVREWVSVSVPKALKALKVAVLPSEDAAEVTTRASNRTETRIDVAFQRKVQAIDAAGIDPLVQLVAGVRDYWLRRRPTNYAAVACLRAEWPVLALPEHLHEHLLFTSVLSLVFVADEAAA